MSVSVVKKQGGDFLLAKSDVSDVYTVEFKSEEAGFIQESVKQFLSSEVHARLEEMESPKGIELTPQLLKQAGELGFLGLEVPEILGGIDLSFKDTLHFVEEICKGLSFSGAIGVQTSIGIAPILLYGSDYLKQKYLPSMMEGKLLSAFSLTEPNAGSDANAGKTRAIIDKASNVYVINGQKAWISNAGIADMFIVFAKIEDDRNLSAFVVEKSFGGITIGAEEKKMGLSGWSTCQVFFDDVRVPKENLLGIRNEGLKIALNTLNTGRMKLGVSGMSNSKVAIDCAVNYAKERHQFGKSISEFGAIQDKLAKMVVKTFALESLVYRAAHDIDTFRDMLSAKGAEYSVAKIDSLKEYRIECAITKVFGSEVQDFVVDEGLQIYGGMGYSAEAPMERLYRSARISRIYEGTNEINRLVIVKEFLKKGMKGELDIFTTFTTAMAEIETPLATIADTDILGQCEQCIENLKLLTIMTAVKSAQKFMQRMAEEQELSMHIADMIINVYALESAVLRIRKLQNEGKLQENAVHFDILQVLTFDTVNSIAQSAHEVIACFEEVEDSTTISKALEKYAWLPQRNIKKLRRNIAAHLIEKECYNFG